MLKRGLITTGQAIEALAAPPEAVPPPPQTADRRGSGVRAPGAQPAGSAIRTRADRARRCDDHDHLDYDLQQQATCTSLTFVRRLEGAVDPSTPCAAADRLPALPPETIIPEPSASALIIDPQTGEVLAAVGEIVRDRETQSLSVA